MCHPPAHYRSSPPLRSALRECVRKFGQLETFGRFGPNLPQRRRPLQQRNHRRGFHLHRQTCRRRAKRSSLRCRCHRRRTTPASLRICIYLRTLRMLARHTAVGLGTERRCREASSGSAGLSAKSCSSRLRRGLRWEAWLCTRWLRYAVSVAGSTVAVARTGQQAAQAARSDIA